MNLSKVGYVSDIEKETLENSNFRKVLFTGQHSQLVLMSLKPGEDIGSEVHTNVDQYIRIEQGEGKVVLNGEETTVKSEYAFIVPAGVEHNLINTGNTELKLYSIYSPAEHPEGTIHVTKSEAMEHEHH